MVAGMGSAVRGEGMASDASMASRAAAGAGAAPAMAGATGAAGLSWVAMGEVVVLPASTDVAVAVVVLSELLMDPLPGSCARPPGPAGGGPGTLRSMGQRRRSNRDGVPVDGRRSRACFTSHLPPEIPQPAPRDVHARGCRQVFGLVDPGVLRLCASGSAPRSPLPGTTVPVRVRPRFHLPLRGSAGFRPASLFIPSPAAREPTDTT